MYRINKRVLDLLVVLPVAVLLSPFLLLIMLILRFHAEGEVFYFQKRIGYGGQFFDIWKFATMLKNSPNMGTGTITLRNDPRVTPVGKYLRITKINEIPQVINVLIGNMTLVGPRPIVEKHFLSYSDEVQNAIKKMKPGITGIGSLVFRDEEELISQSGMDPHQFYKQNISPYKGELELWYAKNASTTTDIKIILLTIWLILFPKSDLVDRVFPDLPSRNFKIQPA